MAATLFAAAVTILIVGFLFYYIVVPILEALGWLRVADETESVKPSAEPPQNVMSNKETAPAPVSGIDTSTISGILDALQRGNLTERERVLVLASIKTADSWWLSGNAIYQAAKGNRNEVLRWIREARGGAEGSGEAATAAPDGDVLITPIAGRVTRRSYYDDPALEYQEPPK